MSSPSERGRECDAYLRIRVAGEFEGSIVQVHVVFCGWRSTSRAATVRNRETGRETEVDGGEGGSGREIGGSSGRRERAAILSSNKISRLSPQIAGNPRQPARHFPFSGNYCKYFSSIYLVAPSPPPLLPSWLAVCSSMSTRISICPVTPPFFDSEQTLRYIFTRPSPDGKPDEHRLRILDDEPAEGRPVGPQVSAFPHRSAGSPSDSSTKSTGIAARN
jgi:hypothetical protein